MVAAFEWNTTTSRLLAEIRELGQQHEDEVTTALDQAERQTLMGCFSAWPINRAWNQVCTQATGAVVSQLRWGARRIISESNPPPPGLSTVQTPQM